MRELLAGMLTAGYIVAGLFFLRFHRTSRDRLFKIFAIAFWLLAAQRVSLVLLVDVPEATLYLYLIRLAAFLLIIGAIVDKNRARAA